MKYLYTLGVLMLCGSAFAQNQRAIDTVQVSATQIPLRLQETGRHITVLTPEVFRDMPSVSIDEILQFIPGVEVQSRGGFGVQANIIMRGSTFTQVLILIDGMRLNDPLTGHFNGYIPVAKEEIERIEVLRGPAAAMYGPDAVGGLINIVTKTFAGTTADGLSGMAEITYGSNAYLGAEASVSQGGERLSWNVSGMTQSSDGELIPGRVVSEEVSLDPYRTFFTLNTVGGSLLYKIRNDIRLKFRTSYDYRDFAARYFYSPIPSDESTETVNQSFSTLHLEQIKDKRRSDIQLSYKYSTDEFVFSPRFPSTNRHQMGFTNFISNHLFDITEKLMVKTGVQVDHRSIISNDRGNHSDWHAGLYTMAMYRPLDGLHLTGSLRGDYDENYGFELLPQMNVSYLPGDGSLVIRGAAGRSIRAADYTERFVSNNLNNLTPGRSLGNPDLLAEVSWSQELGFDLYLIEGLTARITGFSRQSERLIDYVRTPASVIGNVGDLQPDAEYFFARNITDVNTTGVETELSYELRFREKGRLLITGGYTFVNTGNAEDVVSVYISNHARHLATLSTLLRTERFHLGISGLYKARNARMANAINANLEPDYLLWNARAGLQISERFQVSAQVQNVFDIDYQNILGAPMPGRWLIGGLGYRF